MTESNHHHRLDPVASTVCELPVAASVNARPRQKETHNEKSKTSTNNNNDSKDDTAMIQKKIEILSNFLNKAHSLKQQGNACFSRHDFQTAQGHYEQALKIVNQILRNTCRPDIGHDSYDTNQGRDYNNSSNQCCWDSDLRLNVEKLLVSLVGNQAITLYKLANYENVIDCCNSILGSNKNDCINMKQQQLPQQQLPPQQFYYEHDVSKVYYRRALAREVLRQYDLALQDVTTCMEYYLSSADCHKNYYGKSETTESSSSSSSSSLQQKQRQYHDTMVVLERIRSKANEQLANTFNSSSSATTDATLNGDHHRRRRICPVPNATTQRDVIYKLLQQSSIPRMGELFCLIDFKWWKKWCFYVDFYTKMVDMKNHCTAVSGVEEDLWLSYHIPQLSSARHEFDDDYVCMTEDGTYSNGFSNDSYMDYMDDDDEYDYDNDDDEDDEYIDDNEYQGARPYRKIRKPGVIDNSRLLINANQSPTDQFLEEWNSNNNHGGMETTTTFSRTSCNRMQLKPQLVRGHHFEIVPREVYSALKAWYGELTPTIMRRAMVIPPQYPKPVVFLYPQRNIGLLIQQQQQQQQHLFIGNPTVYDPMNGRVGLTNLGNTCFMNAALQCLSHSTPLTRYFLRNQYESDINTTNPIGTGGKLAIAYEAMIRQLWIPKKKQSSISPRALKRAIALFAPRFAGTMQQDSQEFLAFFLDGLHEDLNRIRNPPYIEKADVTHEHDLNVAGAEAWDAHCRRNQSIVMDTFYGQFKSTCICPKCKQISVSFDAFNHMSLEIPQLSNFGTIVAIVLFRANLPAEPPQRYGILVPKHAQMNDVKHQLSVLSQIPTERLAICDIYQSNIYEIIDDNKNVAALNHDDVIVAYEIDPYTNSTIHAIATHVIPTSETESSAVGYPLFMSFNVNLTCRQVIEYSRSRLAYIIPEGATFQVKLVENNGKPMPVFPNLSTSSRLDSFSSVIPDSEDTMTSFLSDDCAESYLFMKIEWTPNISVVSRINFEKYANHPSLDEAITKHRSMLNKTLTLDQCLENFTQPERLDEDNKWYCSRCKDHVRAEKKMTLWRLPNILVIHLKRFEFRNALRREKLDSLVEFPLGGLDMSKYCGSLSVQQNNGDERISLQNEFVVNDIPAVYDLFGVVNHYGRMGFGHYNAYARRWNECKMEDEWMLFDDSSVRGGISRADVVSNAGYILFYRRRNFA